MNIKFQKQIAAVIAAAGLLLGMSGCQKTQPSVPEQSAEPDSAEAAADRIDDESVTKLLTVYASVLDDTFGAECDWGNPSFTDDLASYYEVKNAHTIDELEADLKQYLADGVLDRKALENDFLEKDGKLYAVRGGRGYGYYGIDPAVWERTGDSSVNVLFKILDEPQEGKQASFTFVHTADGWKIDTAVLPV
jgi:hypothetical protein